MKKQYASPVTYTAGTIQVQTLCASGGVTPPPGLPITGSGDPDEAI